MNEAVLNIIIKAVDQASKTAGSVAGTVSKNLDKISSTASNMQTGFDKAGNAIGGLIKPVAAVGAAGAAMVAGFVIKGGLTRALNIEDAQAKLKGLGHSAKNVDTIMSNALASVKGTSFGLGEAATTAANAVAAGVKPGQQLEGVLKTVANTAAIAGTDMGQMGDIFNKVAASNVVYLGSINQLHSAGVPALQFLADELGKTADETSKMVSRGEIDFATFERAMKKGVGNAAEEMGKTTRGSWQNMLAAMSRVGEKIVNKIIPRVQESIRGLTDWFDENSAQIESTAEAVFGVVEKVFDTFVDNIDTVKAAVIGLGAAFAAAKIGSAVTAMIVGVRTLSTQLMVMRTAMAAGATVTQALNVAMMANPATMIATAIVALIGILAFLQVKFNIFGKAADAIKGGWQTLMDWFSEFWSWLSERAATVIDSVTSAWDSITEAVGEVKDKVEEVMGDMLDWLERNETAIRNVAIVIGTLLLPKLTQIGIAAAKSATQSGIAFAQMSWAATTHAIKSSGAWIKHAALSSGAWIKNMPKVIAAQSKAAVQGAKHALTAGAAWVKQATRVTLAWGKAFLAYGKGVAKAALQTGLAAIRMAASWLLAMGPLGLIVALVAGAVALIIANWDTVVAAVLGAWEWIKEAFSTAVNFIKDHWQIFLTLLLGPLGAFIALVITHWDKIKSTAIAVWNKIKDTAMAVWNSITGFIGGIIDKIRGIIDKVKNFVRDAFNAAVGRAKDAVNGLVSWFTGVPGRIKDNIGKLGSLLYDAGKDLIQGAINGVKDSVGKLGSAVGDAAKGAAKKFKNILGISSPSKVFMGYGSDVIAGLVKGITDNAGDAQVALNDLGVKTSNQGQGLVPTPSQAASTLPAPSGSAGTVNHITKTYNITAQLNTAEAVREFYRQLDNDTILSNQGLTPVRGATP